MVHSHCKLFTSISTIRKEFRHGGMVLLCAFYQIGRTITVLNIRTMHDAFQHVAGHIGYDMALAPFDLFACIIAARTTSFCRLHRLAIDNGCRGTALS